MVDENDFFRNATLKICGSLEIEEAMSTCVRYLREFIPVDRMFLQVYESDLGAMRTVATANAERGQVVDFLTPLADEARDLSLSSIQRREARSPVTCSPFTESEGGRF
jgi:hypothetical protein